MPLDPELLAEARRRGIIPQEQGGKDPELLAEARRRGIISDPQPSIGERSFLAESVGPFVGGMIGGTIGLAAPVPGGQAIGTGIGTGIGRLAQTGYENIGSALGLTDLPIKSTGEAFEEAGREGAIAGAISALLPPVAKGLYGLGRATVKGTARMVGGISGEAFEAMAERPGKVWEQTKKTIADSDYVKDLGIRFKFRIREIGERIKGRGSELGAKYIDEARSVGEKLSGEAEAIRTTLKGEAKEHGIALKESISRNLDLAGQEYQDIIKNELLQNPKYTSKTFNMFSGVGDDLISIQKKYGYGLPGRIGAGKREGEIFREINNAIQAGKKISAEDAYQIQADINRVIREPGLEGTPLKAALVEVDEALQVYFSRAIPEIKKANTIYAEAKQLQKFSSSNLERVDDLATKISGAYKRNTKFKDELEAVANKLPGARKALDAMKMTEQKSLSATNDLERRAAELLAEAEQKSTGAIRSSRSEALAAMRIAEKASRGPMREAQAGAAFVPTLAEFPRTGLTVLLGDIAYKAGANPLLAGYVAPFMSPRLIGYMMRGASKVSQQLSPYLGSPAGRLATTTAPGIGLAEYYNRKR